MQNTLRQSATVMAASFHLVGYSKSSSTAARPFAELGRDVFSPMSLAGAAAGTTVSTTPFASPVPTLWLDVAVFSESAMLAGRRLFLASLM